MNLSVFLEDPQIRFTIQKLKTLSPSKIYLFGSRARGDQTNISDYDFAIMFDSFSEEQWAKVANEIREKKPSLHKIDLVRWDQASKEMIEEILKEGILLYDGKQR